MAPGAFNFLKCNKNPSMALQEPLNNKYSLPRHLRVSKNRRKASKKNCTWLNLLKSRNQNEIIKVRKILLREHVTAKPTSRQAEPLDQRTCKLWIQNNPPPPRAINTLFGLFYARIKSESFFHSFKQTNICRSGQRIKREAGHQSYSSNADTPEQIRCNIGISSSTES